MSQSLTQTLDPVPENLSDYDELESEILRIFREEIFLPLLRILPSEHAFKMENTAADDLAKAIMKGRIVFDQGRFTGTFSATTTKELRKLGATWDGNGFTIRLSALPIDVVEVIRASENRFNKVLSRIAEKLSANFPETVMQDVRLQEAFNKTIWKTQSRLKKTMVGMPIQPKLTERESQKIAEEYTNNLKLYIKDFTVKETAELRNKIRDSAYKGIRYSEIAKQIKHSYGVSERKAKFLARQETSLMMTKFKETRYLSAGVKEYIWTCVAGSPKHPVRPLHKANNGKKFSWDKPPVVNNKGERKNPGQDYNCRCVAKPVVTF